MKEKDAATDFKQRVVYYVEKDDATYGPLETGSFMSKNYLDDYLEKRRRLLEESLSKLKSGAWSPIAFHMAMINITEADLAVRVGISRRRLRRHLSMEGFMEMPLRQVAKYAEVFNVPPANLFQILAADEEAMTLIQEKTANPMIVITRPGRRTE